MAAYAGSERGHAALVAMVAVQVNIALGAAAEALLDAIHAGAAMNTHSCDLADPHSLLADTEEHTLATRLTEISSETWIRELRSFFASASKPKCRAVIHASLAPTDYFQHPLQTRVACSD